MTYAPRAGREWRATRRRQRSPKSRWRTDSGSSCALPCSIDRRSASSLRPRCANQNATCAQRHQTRSPFREAEVGPPETSGPVQVFGRRDDERRLALRRPASKKRQGTKSREVWCRLGSERYGDLTFAPAMMVGAKLAPGDLDGCGGGTWKRAMGSLGGRVDRINGRSAR